MYERIVLLLKKVLEKILDNPKIILGYDISFQEYLEILEKGKIKINLLEYLGDDRFF